MKKEEEGTQLLTLDWDLLEKEPLFMVIRNGNLDTNKRFIAGCPFLISTSDLQRLIKFGKKLRSKKKENFLPVAHRLSIQ